MATGNMTVTTAAVHIGEVWVKDMLRAQEFKTVIAPNVFRDWTYDGHGDVYHIRRRPNIEVQTKSASSSLNANTYTDTEQTVTINIHQAAAFKIESIVEVLEDSGIRKEMTSSIGYTLSRAVDVNLASLFTSFSQSVGTLGQDPTYQNWLRAWQYLADAGVDEDSDTCIFVSPAGMAGLLDMDQFVHADYRGTNNARRASEDAHIGRFLDSPVIRSNLLTAPASGQHEAAFMVKRAVALIMAQTQKMTFETIALDLADVVVGDQIYGYAEVDRYSETPGNVTATDEWAVLVNMK